MRSCCGKQGAQLGALWLPRGLGWGKRREAQEEGTVCIIMADFALLYGRNRASLVAEMAKHPPAMQETWVQSLHWEVLLEEGMTTHSSIPAWRIHMDRSLAGDSHGFTRVGHD